MITAKELIETSPSKGEVNYYKLKRCAQNLIDELPSIERRMKELNREGINYVLYYPEKEYNYSMIKTYFSKHGYTVSPNTTTVCGIVISWD